MTGGEQPILIPSLLRHFAHNPTLSEQVWEALRPALLSNRFEQAAISISGQASKAASTLSYRVTRVDDTATRAIIERFIHTIPAMIITGALIAQALGVDYRAR